MTRRCHEIETVTRNRGSYTIICRFSAELSGEQVRDLRIDMMVRRPDLANLSESSAQLSEESQSQSRSGTGRALPSLSPMVVTSLSNADVPMLTKPLRTAGSSNT